MTDELVPEVSKKNGNQSRKVIILLLLLYIFVFVGIMQISIHNKLMWLKTGLIIGCVYFFFAYYYFYDHFLAPYMSEKRNSEIDLIVKKGSVMTIARPNIIIWMFQWFVPALAVQAFVILGFWMTLHTNTYKSSLYTQPYFYGSVYKRMEALRNTSDFNMKDLNVQKRIENAEIIEKEFAGYLNKYSPENKDDPMKFIAAVKSNVEIKIYKIPFLIALTFGFLGALIYSLTDMAYRFNTSDLYPNTFINYVVRFIFAPSLCLVVANFLMNDWWINAAPMIFFFVGFFPQRAMQFIEDKARSLLSLQKEEDKKEIPLGLIQGMTDYIMYRFREIGVGDAQNLAYQDLSYLRNNLGFSDRQICDFVSQAMLLVYLQDDFAHLQAFGIRNIISFKEMIVLENVKEMANLLGMPEGKLMGVLKIIQTEAVSLRIETLEAIIMEAEKERK